MALIREAATTPKGYHTALLFELTDVHFAYRGAPALTGLNLGIPRGRRIALLGANGSGKSTLLKLLAGLYFADAGQILAFGRPLTEDGFADDDAALAFRRRVGLVFQNPDVQLFNPTVFDELAFGPLQLGWPKDDVRRRIEETLDAFALAPLRERSPHRLSGGEKKRVALASTLIMAPEVLLLDEPTAGLDPKSAGDIVERLAASATAGRTVITATHDLTIVEEIADDCVVLDAGQVVAEGPAAAILDDTALLQRTHLVSGRARRHYPDEA